MLTPADHSAVPWPYHFPHPADVIAADAERFRAAAPAERVRQLDELCELAWELAEASTNRDGIEAVALSEEAAWRAAHLKVFREHEPQ